jgi:hypothetical protein
MAGILNDQTMPSLGAALQQQVEGEISDERKKRMAMIQQQQSLGLAGSLSVSSLLAPGGGRAAGY